MGCDEQDENVSSHGMPDFAVLRRSGAQHTQSLAIAFRNLSNAPVNSQAGASFYRLPAWVILRIIQAGILAGAAKRRQFRHQLEKIMRILKIGLYCVIGIALAMPFIELFVPDETPDWPEELVLQRAALLEQQKEDQWQERAAQAGQDQKALERTALDAIRSGRYMDASKSALLLAPGEKKERVMQAMFAATCDNCALLGWSLYALESLKDKRGLDAKLLNKWKECQARQN